MYIYRCMLTLMEATFFSSREVSSFYQTEPVLGNFALAYAFRLCEAAYHSDGSIKYAAHLGALNERGIYVTPGTFLGQPQFLLRTLNTQTDSYWSLYGQGFIAAPPSHGRIIKQARLHPVDEYGNVGPGFRAVNYPQHGRIRLLASGNIARCYVLSNDVLELPDYVRLGKFMSKARTEWEAVPFELIAHERRTMSLLLNPADLGSDAELLTFDLVSVPPTPLVRNATVEGSFYRLSKDEWLPAGMCFGVQRL